MRWSLHCGCSEARSATHGHALVAISAWQGLQWMAQDKCFLNPLFLFKSFYVRILHIIIDGIWLSFVYSSRNVYRWNIYVCAAPLRRGCSASFQTWNRAATRKNLPKIRTKGHSEIWLTRWSACDVTIRAAGATFLLDMATTSIQRGLVEEVEEEEPLPLHAHFHGTLGKSLEDHCHSL